MKTIEPIPTLALDDLLHMAASAIEDLLEHTDPNTNYYSGLWADVPGKLRAAAMLQDGTLTNEGTINCREIAETPTGFDNLTFDEHRKYIGLANIEIRRFQTIPDKKYIADLLTIAVNSLYESINTCGEVSSPAIPEGYVMVPKEPTDEMISSGIAAHYDRSQIQIHDRPAPGPMECAYVAMLAAAPHDTPALNSVQSIVTVPGKWIPVSERVPENDGAYLCWDKRYVTTYAFIFGAWQANQFIAKNITHWMPLPAVPQEAK